MRPWLLLCVCAMVPAAAPADAAPRRRPGKVVRIERARHVAADPVHLCQVISPDEGKLICYGQEPRVGSKLHLVSDSGTGGTGVIRTVAPSAMMDSCRSGTAHDVTVELETPIASGPSLATFALQGVALAADARILMGVTIPALPQRDQERLWAGVDRDGDTAPDMAITASECPDEAGTRLWADGRRATAYCLDYWMDDGHGYARAARDVILQCM